MHPIVKWMMCFVTAFVILGIFMALFLPISEEIPALPLKCKEVDAGPFYKYYCPHGEDTHIFYGDSWGYTDIIVQRGSE